MGTGSLGDLKEFLHLKGRDSWSKDNVGSGFAFVTKSLANCECCTEIQYAGVYVAKLLTCLLFRTKTNGHATLSGM